jgi:hypothetical protein
MILTKNFFLSKNKIELVLFFCLPIIQLYDFEFFKDILNSDDLTSRRIGFPLLTSIALPFYFAFVRIKINKLINLEKIILFYFFLLFIISSIGFPFKIILLINLFYVILFLFSKNPYDNYKSYLICYTALCFFIFFFRIYTQDLNFNDLRNGLNIWGGLTLVSNWLVLFFLTKNKKQQQKILFTSFFIALLYVSRSGIIITTLMIAITYFKLRLKPTLLITIIIVLLANYSFEYLDWIYKRFSYINSNTLTLSRFHIWLDSFEMAKKMPFGVGLGNYIIYSPSGYSNAHNLFLTLIIELSIFAFPFFYLLIRPIKQLIRRKLFILYILFLTLLTFGGTPLWQVGGSVSLNMILGILLINRTNVK